MATFLRGMVYPLVLLWPCREMADTPFASPLGTTCEVFEDITVRW
jgi:hypothetical protein